MLILSPSKKVVFYLFQWKPFKMIENAFYFMLKALYVLGVFTFLSWHLGYVEKQLDKKINSKFMTSQTGQQIITMHIICNISRSKDNQTMKFGQLIEDNMINFFLEKSHT